MPDPDARLEDPDVPRETARGRTPPAAAAAPDDQWLPDPLKLVALTAGVLANIQSVVGEGAAQALFRYGAFEEGKRVTLEAGVTSLDKALANFDALFGQTSTGAKTEDRGVEVRLERSAFIREDRRALDLLLVGLYEGLLNAVYQTRYKGQILGRQPTGDAVLRFDPDPSNA